ncbi:MAG TPA: hypothetical protein VNH22_08930 [Blastocatellia bacterium]|jgi:hypothetical protein|nr:hypothetical protein [Blastocatellia bacterium]
MADEKRERPEADRPEPAAEDDAARIGSAHGAATEESERAGYAREIGERGSNEPASSREVRTRNSGLTSAGKVHPSRRLELRARGFGIGGGYERPYRKDKSKPADDRQGLYGPLPHSGYYGVGSSLRPFKFGQASFDEEIDWYRKQYGEKTSGYEEKKKK